MMEELDELDGPAAIDALREIQRVCESYKGRIPQKAAEAEEGGLEEFAEELGAEDPGLGEEEAAIEIEVSAEPSEPEPTRFMDYGKPSKPRSAPPSEEPRRGPGRPKKVR